jgi:uncharacterized protein with beta-barrel porin domain
MKEHTMLRVPGIFRAMRTTALLCCLAFLAWSPALAEDNPQGHTRTTTLTGTATNYGTISTGASDGMSSGAGETSTNAETGTIRTTGLGSHGIDSSSGTVINSGAISTSGISAYGIRAAGSTIHNSGTITILQSGSGIYSNGGTVYNSGTISSPSHAIHAVGGSATIHLQTGTRILSGDVYGDLGSNHLILEGSGTVDFAITRDWADVTKTGAGTWTFARDFGALGLSTDLKLNGGTLAVNSGVTLNVPADYVQAAGTTLLVTPDGVATPLAVSNTAALAGNLSVECSANTLGSTTVLTALGGLGGTTFDSVTAFNPNFSVNTTYTGISVAVSSTFDPQFDASSMGVTTTLAGAQHFATLASSRGFLLLADAHGAETGSQNGPVMVASAGSLAGLLDRSEEPDGEPRWGMYLQPMLASSSRDAVDGLGYDANMHGIEFGIDRFVAQDVLVGVMGGYASTRLDFKGSSFVSDDYEDQNMFTLGGYAAWGPGNWRITDVLSAGRVEHDSTRNAGLGQTATAHYSSWLISNQLRAAYAWVPADQWEITPRLGLDVIHVSRGGFSESGAVNAVSYHDYDQTFWEGSAALRATRSFKTELAMVSPYAGIGYSRDLSGNDVTVRQYLPTTSAEVTTTNDDNRMTAECGLTMDRDQFKTTLAYNGEFSQNAKSHNLTATFRWEF